MATPEEIALKAIDKQAKALKKSFHSYRTPLKSWLVL